jgi:chaperonin GroES
MSDSPSIRPLRDGVLVCHDDSLEKERKSLGGIVVPAGSYTHESEIMSWGTVVRVGPGRVSKKGKLIPCVVKPGDKVLYNRFLRKSKQGQQLTEAFGEKFVLLEESKDIIALEEQTPEHQD